MKRTKNEMSPHSNERVEPSPHEAEGLTKLRAAIENAPYHGYLHEVPQFGIWHPSINEAAELVAVDMWYSGEIEGKGEPPDLEGADLEQWLKEALSEIIEVIAAGLCSAINNGKLRASPVRRALDDHLEREETHVYYDDLCDWMKERGLHPGDHMSSWVHYEATIDSLICEEVAFLRAAQKGGTQELENIERQRRDAKYGKLDEALELDALRAALKAKLNQIHELQSKLVELRSRHAERVDRPLHTRQRRTLLTIIAALCSQAGFDYDVRGAAQRIRRATELIGAPIDDGTIDGLLKEIPDALESRMK
jgi:hypothetical protein